MSDSPKYVDLIFEKLRADCWSVGSVRFFQRVVVLWGGTPRRATASGSFLNEGDPLA